MSNKIEEFRGDFRFLSNFFPEEFVYLGKSWSSSEHAYQAQKTLDPELQETCRQLSNPVKSKNFGKEVDLRSDWDDVKLDIMYEVLKCKFTQNKILGELLILTEDAELVEGNHWGDTYWGVCKGVGQNNLGKLLMKIREEINDI